MVWDKILIACDDVFNYGGFTVCLMEDKPSNNVLIKAKRYNITYVVVAHIYGEFPSFFKSKFVHIVSSGLSGIDKIASRYMYAQRGPRYLDTLSKVIGGMPFL